MREANAAWSPLEVVSPSQFIEQICSGQASLYQINVFLIGKKISHCVFGALKLIHSFVEPLPHWSNDPGWLWGLNRALSSVAKSSSSITTLQWPVVAVTPEPHSHHAEEITL